jgi:hypothetical protein
MNMTDTQALFDSCQPFLDQTKFDKKYLKPIFKRELKNITVESQGIEQLKEHIAQNINLELYKDRGWLNDKGEIIPLYYKFTEYGYRECTEDYKAKSIAAFGCSDTFGKGSYLNHTWPYILSKQLNKPVHNCGVPGASIKEVLKNILIFLDKANIETIAILIPERAREFFIFQSNSGKLNSHSFNPGAFDSIDIVHGASLFGKSQQKVINHYKNACISDEYIALSFVTDLNAIENICSKRGIKLMLLPNPLYYSEYYEDYTLKTVGEKLSKGSNYSLSRDFIHFGQEFQTDIASYFTKRYRKLLEPVTKD